LAAIVAGGETDEVEFKQTLRLNLFANKVEAGLAEKAAREIAALMNAQGSKMIVGATDDGQLLGVDDDEMRAAL
jgi:GTPase